MTCRKIDAKCIHNAFLSGSNEVLKNKNAINKINVFPVADGDTGTNLALTLNAVNRSPIGKTAGETIQSMANAALSGARGNSGIIFAEFIGGLAEYLSNYDMINIPKFAEALKNGKKRAYNAISDPVEGTILSIIKDFSHSVNKLRDHDDLDIILPNMLKSAKKALDKTPNQLDILKKSKVVDAGAEGFYLFLVGFTNYFIMGQKKVVAATEQIDSEIPNHINNGRFPVFRYCTEAFIEENTKTNGQIRDSLKDLGDSLIVAGSGERCRIHIHTNEPAEIFKRLNTHSRISEQKVDDMVREYDVTQNRKNKIALLTDSVCDLPKEIFDEHQIHVIPMNIFFDNSQYLDGVTIESSHIYDYIDQLYEFPSTSQPSPLAFNLMYSFLTTHYDSVIAIHVSSKLSNTYNMSKLEADKFGNSKISVIDSLQNSGAQGLVVLRAAEDIAAGKPHDDVVKNILKYRLKAKILVKVNTLKYMVKGGRVSPLKGLLAKIINLKPIVSLDKNGASVIYDKAFNGNRTRKKILDLVQKEMKMGKLKYFGVVYGVMSNEVNLFQKELETLTGMKCFFTQPITPIVGLHAGPETFAVVTMRE